MTDITPPLSDRPAHYRLKAGTWEVILKEYVEGATAPELAAKWRVSEHALRKRITEHGATKRDHGDAQAITQAAMREEALAQALAEARANDPEARAGRLFDGVELDEAESDPGVLGKAAVLASGRAMTGRLWAEAKALAGLAESYGRLAKTAGGAGVTVETIDLPLLYEILFERQSDVHSRFALWDDGPETEHYALRRKYWDRVEAGARAMKRQADHEMARCRHQRALEQQVRDLGGEPPKGPEI